MVSDMFLFVIAWLFNLEIPHLFQSGFLRIVHSSFKQRARGPMVFLRNPEKNNGKTFKDRWIQDEVIDWNPWMLRKIRDNKSVSDFDDLESMTGSHPYPLTVVLAFENPWLRRDSRVKGTERRRSNKNRGFSQSTHQTWVPSTFIDRHSQRNYSMS